MQQVPETMTATERRASIGLASIYGLRMLGLFIILPIFAIYAEHLPGGESHFSAVHATIGGEEIRTANVLRRDGREIGRERVIDLRGSLHHYGPASAGWLVTTGQCLSVAREEACAPGTVPITLFDNIGFAKLLEENDVAVLKTKFSLPYPDIDLLETLRGL